MSPESRNHSNAVGYPTVTDFGTTLSTVELDREQKTMTATDTTPLYRAVVFRRIPASQDFSLAREIVLPGEHSPANAWHAVFRRLREPDAAELIGGEIRAVCGN
jgi:hypothetical protein